MKSADAVIKKTRVIGFDTSSNALAFSVVEKRVKKWALIGAGRIDLDSDFMDGKIEKMISGVPVVLSQYGKIDKVVIEQSIYVQNAFTTIKLSQVIGALWTICLQHGIEVELVQPSQWKNFLGYKRVSKADKIKWSNEGLSKTEVNKKAAFERKDRVKRILQEKCNAISDIDDDNIVDAIGVAVWGIATFKDGK